MTADLRALTTSTRTVCHEDYRYGSLVVRRAETVVTVDGEETERRVSWTTPTRGGRRLQGALAAVCEEARADNP